ncbi:LamG domain-containing protein [Blastopirellula sp. JC732]|uniref:LamG domain-containing protein n=1 Tax=Blastopirellula sediminis TaxID=2894196 RepID=A0A9X1MT76_9BACT|nr:LamG domain-containing protein [Blastopirellula sediminis]MCC9604547.1 LamG domain-containing protein [Blastopirellula sediminis]MCC9632154.1 LamG domain-containing protein [Blastopirellula sediminis]
MSSVRRQRRPIRQRRSGIAVVIVLALLSITLAMSYAMMRTQMSASQIERNMHRAGSARHAALSGLAIGVRKMHASDWQGVNVPLSGTLSDNESYIVTYETGDAKLTAADPDWSEYPYRVTVKATGVAFDPLDTTYKSEYSAEAVVQLVRKKRTANPSHFTSSQAYTTYLWGTQTNSIDMPVAISGSAHIQGTLDLLPSMPTAERPFYGLIDELAIFDRQVDWYNINQIYQNGNGDNATVYSQIASQSPSYWWRFNESSSASTTAAAQAGGKTGTYIGGTLPGVTVNGTNRAAFFDGKTGHLDLGKFELPATGKFTILAWVAPFSGDADNTYARIISKATSVNASDHVFMLGLNNGGSSTPRLRTHMKLGGSAYTHVASGGDVTPGQWSLVAVTYDGSTLRFYKNGSYYSGYSVSGTPGTNSAASVWIGDNPPGSARTRYLSDLQKMNTAGLGDARPLKGSVRLNQSTNAYAGWLTLARMLGLSVNFATFNITTPTEITAAATTYQLYPGGKAYTVPAVSGTVSNRSYAPSMTDNPLGVVRLTGNTTFGSNIKFEGMCITPGDGIDLTISGDNVQLKAPTLPALIHETGTWELPAIYGRDDVFINDAQATIEGAVIASNAFEVQAGADDAKFALTGMLHAQQATIGTRAAWDAYSGDWGNQLSQFIAATGGDADDYFPQWLAEQRGLQPNDNLSIAPPAEARSYYWPDLSQPIYVADPTDEGLAWEYVRRSENGAG